VIDTDKRALRRRSPPAEVSERQIANSLIESFGTGSLGFRLYWPE
jgi:hypothetical protein